MSEKALCNKFPLHRACRDGDVNGLLLLLHDHEAAHTHITLEDTYYGWTPSHWAAYFGKLECLRVLVGEGGGEGGRGGRGTITLASPALTTSRFTQTPAHIAAFAGHPHCLSWLLQAGAHTDAQDYLGETALHKAARTGSLECVNILLNSKAKISVHNNNGQTAGQLAEACSYSDLATHLNNITHQQQEGMDASDGGSMCSIARSVPAHGLNGGVFPHCPTSSLVTNGIIVPHTNGTTGHTNGIAGHANGITGHANGTTGHANGITGHTNGITGHANGIAGHTNGITGHANGISGHSNGVVGHTNGITRGQVNGSVLSNGTTNGTFTSSNGYYGFQPTSVTVHQDGRQPASVTGHQDGRHQHQQPEDDVDMEMDTDGDCHEAMNGNHTTNGNPTNTTNGIHSIVQNNPPGTPFPQQHTHTNNNTTTPTTPPAFTTNNVQTPTPFPGFTAPLKKDGVEGVINTGGVSEDITLNPGISHNYIPIGGRKRSREEVFVTEMKRMRTEDNTTTTTTTTTPQEMTSLVGAPITSTPPPSLVRAPTHSTPALAPSLVVAPNTSTPPPPPQDDQLKAHLKKAREEQQWIWVV
ncbi:hypothetical protein Pmani_016207 [Petrolisthes manimaculis]|uniref:Ankyrin repeat domain-containing protein 10 n=1 Tax=Petrolisthes manimaculis TaxID=1843537 RepID=A0AAE1U6Y3_9EUCA|nr:hypothetical protein Pmani_016207 [Petrolisthes manimaculis]